MTLKQFKDKYLGKQVEYHSYGPGSYNQCVDLINQYISDILDNNTKDYTEIIGTNAKDFKTKYDPEDFEWIENTPSGVPRKGDIIVWNGRVGGGAGHVAIFLEGDVNSFRSLDQNWSQKERVTLENHNYKNVSGWLKPKGSNSDMQEELNKCNNDRNTNWNIFNKVMDALGLEADPKDKEGSAESAVSSYAQTKARSDRVAGLEKQLETIEKAHAEQISILEKQLLEKDELIENLQNQHDDIVAPYIKQLKDKDEQIVILAEQVKNITVKLADCEAGDKGDGLLSKLILFIKGIWKG